MTSHLESGGQKLVLVTGRGDVKDRLTGLLVERHDERRLFLPQPAR